MCMETGLSRHKNSINVALKNAADFGLAVVIFWLFGFGLMFERALMAILELIYFFKTDQAEYMTYFVFQYVCCNRSNYCIRRCCRKNEV